MRAYLQFAARIVIAASLTSLSLDVSSVLAASPYQQPAEKAALWLAQQQKLDGSWGNDDAVRTLLTLEVVLALRTFNQRSPTYFWGVTWLENHKTPGTDFTSRRVSALASLGENVASDVSKLQSTQGGSTTIGNRGWGVTGAYIGSPLDTAFALQAAATTASGVDTVAALDYLKTAQLTGTNNRGWAVASETASEALTTAQVILALKPWSATDSTLNPLIANAAATLGTVVTTASPTHLRALAAMALTKAGADPGMLLASLASAQGADGSIDGGNIYATALALRAFAVGMGVDTSDAATRVSVPDAALRAAVNQALGRNDMDVIDRGELARLTTLSAAGLGISDLTGLEWAANLVSADLRNNNVTSTVPIDGLTQLATLLLDGNPVAAADNDYDNNDIPTLPEWGVIIMATLLLISAARRQRAHRHGALHASV